MPTDNRKILFLLSLPRSGSTLVQDHLAATLKGAVTVPETWIIPFAMAARNELSFSPIGLEPARIAESQFGVEAFSNHIFVGVQSFLLSILDAKSGEVLIEKTPRNLFYYREITRYMTMGRVVVLCRHPLDIALSSFEYFCGSRPNLARVSIDLIQGMDELVSIIQNGNDVLVRFEDFLLDEGESLGVKLYEAGIEICKDNPLYDRQTLIDGRMGDEKFKRLQRPDNSTSYRHQSTRISLVTYLVLWALTKRSSYRYLMETVYGDLREDALVRLRKNINRVGLLDALCLVSGYVSAAVNLKVTAFKLRKSSLFKYLR